MLSPTAWPFFHAFHFFTLRLGLSEASPGLYTGTFRNLTYICKTFCTGTFCAKTLRTGTFRNLTSISVPERSALEPYGIKIILLKWPVENRNLRNLRVFSIKNWDVSAVPVVQKGTVSLLRAIWWMLPWSRDASTKLIIATARHGIVVCFFEFDNNSRWKWVEPTRTRSVLVPKK